MTKCPKCGEELKVILKISGEPSDVEYCRNDKCKGWFCFYCDEWHPYGTHCSCAAVVWDAIDSQEKYDEWCEEHMEDLKRMLKDSGWWFFAGTWDVEDYEVKEE